MYYSVVLPIGTEGCILMVVMVCVRNLKAIPLESMRGEWREG